MRSSDKLSAVAKLLTWVWAPFVLAGVYLGLPGRYTHHTIAPHARILFIPGGCVLLVQTALIYRMGQRAQAGAPALAALASIGVGAHEALAGPWTLLAVPACVMGALVNLRAAVVGRRDPWFERLRRRRNRRVATTRLMCAVLVVLFVTGLVLALAAA